MLDRASEAAPIAGRSRALCAALGVLAEDAARALGARASLPAVGEAASLLSLLTKVDDEVIDRAAFHGGPLRRAGHRDVRRKTRRHLAPTLDSLLTARAANGEARCELAAEVGGRLRALAASRDRLDRLHAVIARGWETQVRAVDMLGRHPGHSSLSEVAQVTTAISADWLLMITMVGGLPADARRDLDETEMDAFGPWGWHIQRADALADFTKDAREGLANSWAGRVCFERFGAGYTDALARLDVPRLEAMLQRCAADCLPGAGELEAAGRPLARLGAVATDLGWIHAMLVGRWQARRKEAC